APASLTKITIDFDQAMDVATFYYPVPQGVSNFPLLTADPYWTNGNKTFNLPCTLNPGLDYQIPINTINQIFRSAQAWLFSRESSRFERAYLIRVVRLGRPCMASKLLGQAASLRVEGLARQ